MIGSLVITNIPGHIGRKSYSMFRVGTFEVIEAVTVLCYQPNWFETRFNEGGLTPNKEELPVLYRRM